MRCVPSANGISCLMLHPMIIVLLCCILLVLLLIHFYIHVCHVLQCWKHASPVVTWLGLKWMPKSSPHPHPRRGKMSNSTFACRSGGFAGCLVYTEGWARLFTQLRFQPDTQLMPQPDVCWSSHWGTVRATHRQDAVGRRDKGHSAAVVTWIL